MPECIHEEKSGEWTGHVWRQKDTPDQQTNYFWSLSYSGDVHQAAQQSEDCAENAPNLVPDSSFYPSQEQATQALLDQLKQRGG